MTRVSPLGWLLPPSYAAGWLDRSPRCLAWLARLESMAQGSRGLASVADHYIFEAHRASRPDVGGALLVQQPRPAGSCRSSPCT
ncbi:MAG: hypothetical protein U1F35_06125 [Steroidobacteraceae bacterium]